MVDWLMTGRDDRPSGEDDFKELLKNSTDHGKNVLGMLLSGTVTPGKTASLATLLTGRNCTDRGKSGRKAIRTLLTGPTGTLSRILERNRMYGNAESVFSEMGLRTPRTPKRRLRVDVMDFDGVLGCKTGDDGLD